MVIIITTTTAVITDVIVLIIIISLTCWALRPLNMGSMFSVLIIPYIELY